MLTKIETIYDLLEYAKEHPNYQYTCYDGEWLIYPDNTSSYLKDIEINYKMMRVLEDWNKILDFEYYTISHRAVRNFKIDYEYAKKKIEEIKTFLETAIVTVKDKKYSSLKQIEDALSIGKYKISHDKTTIRNSYWGSGWETQAFDVFNYDYDYGNKNHYLMRIPYYMKQNVVGKKMFKFLLLDYVSVFNGWSESSRNYRIPQESGGYIISNEYYKKEKEALDKAYNEILEKKEYDKLDEMFTCTEL